MQTFALRKNFAPLFLTTAVLLLPFVVTVAASNTDIWMMWLMCGSLAALQVFGYLCSGVRLDSRNIRIRADIYWKTIAYTDIVSTKIINLKLEPALHTQWHTFGTCLPRYFVGHFQLSNAEKGFLFVTDDQNVVHLRTKNNDNILLCFADNQSFFNALEVTRANA
jgi:hypothetical protein